MICIVTLSRQGKAERGREGERKGRREEGREGGREKGREGEREEAKKEGRWGALVSMHEEVCAGHACKWVVVITNSSTHFHKWMCVLIIFPRAVGQETLEVQNPLW